MDALTEIAIETVAAVSHTNTKLFAMVRTLQFEREQLTRQLTDSQSIINAQTRRIDELHAALVEHTGDPEPALPVEVNIS